MKTTETLHDIKLSRLSKEEQCLYNLFDNFKKVVKNNIEYYYNIHLILFFKFHCTMNESRLIVEKCISIYFNLNYNIS